MRKIVILFLIFFSGVSVFASHTMGGDFTYKLLSTNGNSATYQLTLKVYRDCSNTSNLALDNQITIKVYYAHNDQLYQNVVVNLFTKTNVLPDCIDSTVACIEEGIYRRNVTLTSASSSSFYGFNLAWARCCRNDNLTNITDDQGQLWTAFIPSHIYKNSSVQYLNIPVPFLCRNRTNTFNLNAFDSDGDSLVFRLVRPYRAGSRFCSNPTLNGCSQGDLIPPYREINYRNGYNETFPFGTGSSITIDSATGEITATVNQNGNYVMAIEVEEFRKTFNGTYESMGKTRRDIQYIVRSCPANEAPFIDSTYSGGYNKQIKTLSQICFNIRAFDIDNDSVYITRIGAIFDNSQGLDSPYASLPEVYGKDADTTQFCWTPGCSHVSESPYIFTVFTNDDKCNQRQRTYSVKVLPLETLNKPNVACTEIVNDSTIKTTWLPPTDTTGLAFYRIYRGAVGSTGFTLLDTVYSTGNLTTYTDLSISDANSKSYRYYVSAVNECGKDGTNSDTLNTLVLSFNRQSAGKGDLEWASPQNSQNYTYQINRFNGSAYAKIDSTDSLNYFLNECIVNTNHRVEVETSAGCNIISNPINIWLTPSDSVPPAPPILKYASVTTTGNIEVNWNESDSPYVKFYEVWQSADGGAFTMQTTLNYDTSYIHTGANTKNSIYSYYIVAKDSCPSANQSAPSDTISIIIPSVSTKSCTPLVNLNWNMAKQFGSSTQFIEVERATNGGSFSSIKTLSASDTLFTDTAVLTTNNYCYRLKSTSNNTGFTAYSDSICIIPETFPLPTSVPLYSASVTATGSTTGETVVRWKRVNLIDTFARSYLLYHATDSNGAFTEIDSITTLNDTTYTHQNIATASTRNFYFLKVRDFCGYVSQDSSERHGTIVLSAIGGNLNAALNWTPYKGWAVNNYNIYRGTATSQQLLASVNGTITTYNDTGLSCGNNYYYRVEAVGSANGLAVQSQSNTDSASVYDLIAPPLTTMARTSVFTTSTTLGQVLVEWAASTEKNRQGYNIYRSEAGAPFTLAGTINNTANGTISFIDNSLNTETQTNSYYISVIDSCGNESPFTSTHTVSNITTNAGFSEVDIAWTPYIGFANYNYEIQRREPGVNWTTLDTLPKDSLTYKDLGTTCKTPYNYRIKINNLDVSGLFSLSDTTLTLANDTTPPQPPYMVNVTREPSAPNVVFVQWTLSPEADVKEYVLQRSRRHSPGWQTIFNTTTNDTFYYDTLSNINTQSYCYRLYAIDLCNNVSQVGNIGCLIILRGSSVSFANKLAWEGYTNWPLGVQEYRIYRSENNDLFFPINDVSGNANSFTDSLLSDTANLFCYYIEAQENFGGFTAISTSNTVCVTQKASYYIPNAFSPGHSEGLNDVFGPQGLFIAKVKIDIFDRWGKQVYTNKGGERFWDGRDNNGNIMPEGVYMYHILVYSYDSTKSIERGNVTILR